MNKSISQEDQKAKNKELKQIAKEKKRMLEIKELEERERLLNLKSQKRLDKTAAKESNQMGKYGTSDEPRKSLSTFFRNQNKLDISVVSILDRKASILMRICVTLISGLIVFHDFIDNNVDNGHLISTVLMIGLMITLVLAILATKPFVSRMTKIIKEEIEPKYLDVAQNLFMGINHAHCSLEEYEEAMERLVKSQDLQLGNQIRASYIISKNNGFKSVLVDWAFNIFLCSFVVVGILYIVAKFF